jgi:Bacterial dnaA protein helix-turn-helix
MWEFQMDLRVHYAAVRARIDARGREYAQSRGLSVKPVEPVVPIERVQPVILELSPPPKPKEQIPNKRNTREIIQGVCERHGITYAELVGHSRKHYLMPPRVEAARLLRERGISFPEIGRILHRDHSTIVHALSKLERM